MRWHETAGAVTPLPAAPAVEAVIAEAVARRRAAAFAAGTAMNSELDIEGNAGMTIADTLASVPGVIVQSFFRLTTSRAFRFVDRASCGTQWDSGARERSLPSCRDDPTHSVQWYGRPCF